MGLNGTPQELPVSRIVTLEEAAELTTEVGLDEIYGAIRLQSPDVKQRLATLLALHNDIGIEGHNYGDAKRKMIAVLRAPEPSVPVEPVEPVSSELSAVA